MPSCYVVPPRRPKSGSGPATGQATHIVNQESWVPARASQASPSDVTLNQGPVILIPVGHTVTMLETMLCLVF